jgi:hypothetical protein
MSKRANDLLQERVILSFDHPQVTADTTWKFFKVPAGRKLRIDQVDYINATGLAEDATNIFALLLKADATTVASLSTDSAAATDASIPANTFVALTLAADAALVAAADAVLSLTADEGGTATLPAGRLVVHARYVQ